MTYSKNMGSLQKQAMNEPLLHSKTEASSELERILSDATSPPLLRYQKALVIEMRYLFGLAGPGIIVYLLNFVTWTSTQVLCGHIGNIELAAASLGNEGVQLLAYGLMVILIDPINTIFFPREI